MSFSLSINEEDRLSATSCRKFSYHLTKNTIPLHYKDQRVLHLRTREDEWSSSRSRPALPLGQQPDNQWIYNFFLFLFFNFSVLFEWYRMKTQASVKINCMPSLNDPRHVAEIKENVKVHFTLEYSTKAQRYSPTFSLTSALDRGGCQDHALPTGKTGYPLYRRLGGP